MSTWILILTAHYAVTVVPTPFTSSQSCVKAGSAWVRSAKNIGYKSAMCMEVK